MTPLLERFITYCKLDTRSDSRSETVPTTEGQVVFARILEQQLRAFNLTDIYYNEANGFLTARLPKNTSDSFPAIGFIAHLDTADFHSVNINPQVFYQYDGQDVVLNKELDIVMKVSEFPNLEDYVGQTLITTDGTTLLGADDKAGIVEILGAIEYFLAHPEEGHGDIWIAFGPDEEIGTGADRFDVNRFPAEYAYTIDSGRVGHFEYETFNAAQAIITIDGTSVHPGTAYGMMVNALKISQWIDQKLPQDDVPEKTRDREGFYLLHNVNGTVDRTEMVYIIRDHDSLLFEQRKKKLIDIVAELNASLDRPRIDINVHDQYYNMGDVIKQDMRSVEVAIRAMKALEIDPIVTPFRGGTDGSKLSLMGLPTPNLFTGGENFHGQYEFITLEAMETAVRTIIQIVRESKEQKES